MKYLRTDTLPIADLQPYPGNARVHDDAALDESAQVNGQYRSVVAREVDGGYQLLAGHGTVGAFKRQGDDAVRVEVIEADDTEARRIVLTDNGSSRNASYDDRLLLDLIDQASRDGGLGGTGWDADAYKELLDEAGSEAPFDFQGDPDDVDLDRPTEAVTQLGDVWMLGRHRLACGDCRDTTVAARLLNGAHPVLVLTDPPYGVAERTDRGSKGRGGPFGGIARGGPRIASYDHVPVHGDDEPFDPSHLLTAYPRLVLFGANHYADRLPPSPSWIVWDKLDGLTTDKRVVGLDDNADAELAWTNLGGPARVISHRWKGLVKASEHGESRVHPTQKPIALMARILEWRTDANDAVYEPYAGSGSTLVACEITGRVCYAAEIAPAYCDVIARRYQDLTGDKPVLERTGEPYDFTADPPCVAA